MLVTTLTSLLVPLLTLFGRRSVDKEQGPTPLQFELRHLHASTGDARVVFADVPAAVSVATGSSSYTAKTRRMKAYKPSSFDAYSEARLHSIKFGQSQSIPWSEVDLSGPDHENRHTLLTLAKMSNNAYVYQPGDPYWYELVDGNWSIVSCLF
jgi:lipase ATG15